MTTEHTRLILLPPKTAERVILTLYTPTELGSRQGNRVPGLTELSPDPTVGSGLGGQWLRAAETCLGSPQVTDGCPGHHMAGYLGGRATSQRG